MKFISTRGDSPSISASTAIITGLAPDGGLYVPMSFPKIEISESYINNYADFAAKIIQPFFEGDPLYDDIPEICRKAFSFDVPLYWLDKSRLYLNCFMDPLLHLKISVPDFWQM